jgi:glyoxylase-like metal-dependent hydrolase (beta-lactamase superfamily II)
VSQPVSERPEIHQIVLPLARAAERTVTNVQVYLIEGEPLTLIDTGLRSPESHAALELALEELGHDLAEIERVIVTHGHADHIGLVETLRRSGARLECCVHESDVRMVESWTEVITKRSEQIGSLFHEFGVPEAVLDRLEAGRRARLVRQLDESEPTGVDRILRDTDRLAFKSFELVVRHSPGHSPGHILLEDEELGVLFTGDHVMAQAIPNTANHYVEGGHPDPRDPLRRQPRFRGLREIRRSLRALRGHRFKRLLPAYGGVIRRADRAIRDTLLFYDVRIQRIDRGLRHLAALGQDVTAYDIWKSLFPQDEPYEVMRAHMILLIGALDCLEDEGKLETRRRSDGVLIHHHS